MSRPTPREIATWYPERWDYFVGNTGCIKAWSNFLRFGGTNMLFTGPIRSGKTRMISLGIMAALCPHRSPEGNPCHACETCRQLCNARGSHNGVLALLTGATAGYFDVDCESVTTEELRQLKSDVGFESKAIVYLDEVAALGKKGLDSFMLKVVDESSAVWIASSVTSRKRDRGTRGKKAAGLSDPLLARFVIKEGTTLPSAESLATWVKARCQDWEITIESEEITVPLLVERTRHRGGFVIAILSAAAFQGRRLTFELVQGFNFHAAE